MALLLSAAKSIVANDRRVRSGEWPRELLIPIRGRTFGLLGLGRIGRSTAIRAKALGCKVIATERYPDMEFVAKHQLELVELDELLACSDFLSVHCPLNEETQGMFDRQLFRKMKPGAIFINTARGPLVNENDLLDALQNGPLHAAGLDVLCEEPPPTNHPFFALDTSAKTSFGTCLLTVTCPVSSFCGMDVYNKSGIKRFLTRMLLRRHSRSQNRKLHFQITVKNWGFLT